MTHDTPPIPPVNADAIPAELRALDRWLNWRYELCSRKWTKVPCVAGSDHRASVTNRNHWREFDTALAGAERPGYGLGFVLGDGIAGVDLDDCVDPTIQSIAPWAEYVIEALSSYAEVSPSGTGVKIFVRGSLPEPGKGIKRPEIEVYDRDRFFTITGLHLPGSPSTIEEA